MRPYDRRVEPSAYREPVYQYTYVTDESHGRRIADAVLRALVLRRQGAALLAGIVLVLVGAMLLGAHPWATAVTFVVALGVGAFVVRHRLRRRLGALNPAGTVYRSGLGPDVLWLQGPLASTEIPYRALRGVRVVGDVVHLQTRTGSSSICPRALFPGGAVEELRVRIAAAQSPTTART